MIHSLNCLPCQDNAWCEYVWFVWFVSQIVLRTNFDCWFGCNAELVKGGWLILTHLRFDKYVFNRNPDWFENTNINKNTNRFENNGAASRPPLPSGFRLALNQTDSRKKKHNIIFFKSFWKRSLSKNINVNRIWALSLIRYTVQRVCWFMTELFLNGKLFADYSFVY